MDVCNIDVPFNRKFTETQIHCRDILFNIGGILFDTYFNMKY